MNEIQWVAGNTDPYYKNGILKNAGSAAYI